jgi:hypothetical protein
MLSINYSTISRLLFFRIAFVCLCNSVVVHCVHGPPWGFYFFTRSLSFSSDPRMLSLCCYVLRSVVLQRCTYPHPVVWPTYCEGPLFTRACLELSYMNLFQTVTPYTFKIKFNSILPSATPFLKWSLRFMFADSFFTNIVFLVPLTHLTCRPEHSHRMPTVSSEINVESGDGKWINSLKCTS